MIESLIRNEWVVAKNEKRFAEVQKDAFDRVTFGNLSIFWPIFNLNDVIRRFCDATNLT